MSRPWLRHPARIIRPSLPCPTGQPRFASVSLARAALSGAVGDARLETVPCDLCGGAHHQPGT